MGKKKDNESVMQNKDCNIEMTDVASNTSVCRQKNKNKSVMLNKDCNIEIKKTAMLNKDCNSKDMILINDRTEEGIDKCNYQEITDCPVDYSFDINTIMDKNNNWNNESVTQNKDCNIQAKKIVILNKDYSNKEIILIDDKTEEGIDKCNYQEITDCPVSFGVYKATKENSDYLKADLQTSCDINTISFIDDRKNKSVMLNTDCNIEAKKSVILNKDCNNKERILIDDKTEEDINTIMNKNNNWINKSVTQNKDCNIEMTDVASNTVVYKATKENSDYLKADLQISCDINTISFRDDRKNKSVMLNTDCNIEAKKTVILNKDCNNKERILIDDKTEEGIDKCNYQEITDCPVSFDINTIMNKNNNWINKSVTQNKDCNIEMTDVASNTSIDKPTSIGENGNKKKSEAEKKNCDNQITDLPIYFDDTMDVLTCSFVENDFLQTDNIDDANISLSCLLNTSVYENLDKHVKKLSFNTIEELSMSKDTCILPTCQNEIEVCNANINVSISPSPVDVEDEESGSEYIPSEDDHDLLDNNDEELPQIQKSIVTDQNMTVSSISSLDASKANNDTSVCDDENMYVDTSDTKIIKQNYCMFCSKLQTQLARHLETVHRNEPDVKKFAVLPKNNPERRTIIDTLRKNGNFKFNTQSKLNNGKLIVCRRPNKKHQKDATDFTVCAKCKGFFAKSTICHHSRNCFGKKFTKNKCIMIMGRKVVSRLHPSASEILRKNVFPVMREDEVSRVIRYDELLILYANKLCIKYKSQHHHDMIRATQ